ncbi:MAG: acetoacetate--CoA ligase [Chloroflexi bacterium]|nr:acetoacetate--CoA ligase [Chloroflexota bacterium]
MSTVEEGTLLWQPSDDVIAEANLTRFMDWLARERGLQFGSYDELWAWSVSQIEAFWQSIWDYFGVTASARPEAILPKRTMPGAEWFPGARLNYAENIFSRMKRDGPAVIYQPEEGPAVELDYESLRRQTAALAALLRDLGVQRGDRVAAYLPNIPEAIVGLLATASLGAIWSSCSPDFGSRSVLDRFSQIEPKVLLAVDGYRYNGKPFDRRAIVRELQAALPSLQQTILVPQLYEGEEARRGMGATRLWDGEAHAANGDTPLAFEQLPFDHPLWVLYSSGTTGLPKPLVHGHGGIVLEHLKETVLHMDLQPGDRFYWYTSTGWMMWNYLVGGLLSGASIVVYNGAPAYPDFYRQWKMAEELGITYFGTSAAFIHACMKEGVDPAERHDLQSIRALGSTGSPLSPAGFAWVYDHVSRHLALESFSGGTDLCTGFLGGVRTQPVYAAEIQARSLGASVQAWNDAGQPVTGEVGELVITQPMPTMPLYFWNDEGHARYLSSYFEMYPGVWRHGDWIKINERGGCVIYGRSDATINRYGVRMGTSEIYDVVQSLDEVTDCLVVDLEGLEGESYMPLFVVLATGAVLDDALQQKIRDALREQLSPRHVPDEIVAVPEIPYTLSGKKMELPVRRVLKGRPLERAANPDAMRNPRAIEYFVEVARRRQKG